MLICKICGYSHEFMISPSHLKMHGITGKQYKEMFPGDILRIQTSESKAKSSKTKKKIFASGELVIHNKDKSLSHEHRKKLSDIKKHQYKTGKIIHWNIGKKLSNEIKVKIGQSVKKYKFTNEQKTKHLLAIRKLRCSSTYIPPRLGKFHNASSKAKISKSLLKMFKKKSEVILQHHCEKAILDNLTVLSVDQKYWFNLRCNACNTSFSVSRQAFNISTRNGQKLCPTCYPRLNGRSKSEIELYNEIKLLKPSAIANDRIVLHGKEIDVYIPELNIGFEFTGIYWHSERNHNAKYNLLWKQQYAFKNQIILYTIFEDEWLHNKNLVLSRIKSILQLNTIKLYARNCTLKLVSAEDKSMFLKENDLQQNDKSMIFLGLYFKEELVSLATFNKIIFNKKSMWELSRYCSKSDYSVLGAASKLIKHFNILFNKQHLAIITFVDRRWSSSDFYKKIGFTFDSMTEPDPWYFTKGSITRLSTDKLTSDPDNFDKIWDCGKSVWILKRGN